MWSYVGGVSVLNEARGREPAGLVGRAREQTELRALLAGHRLVTVSGCAGVGKSRLASAVTDTMTQGPWRRVVTVRWQGRGQGAPGALGAAAVGALTGVRPDRHTADAGAVVRSLPAEPTLLFLDDVDPVHAECMGLVQHLLMAAPTLRVLVTSRHCLGLGDEHVLALGPLSVETPDGADGLPAAVELFERRARAVVAGFRAAGADLAAVEDMCRTLEGVPLAIELAAGQLARHSVRELAAKLEHHQSWLTGRHSGLRRHRSLRDAVGAGYVLCERAERVVWARVSIFAGSFAESTAVYLCAGGGVEPHDVPGCLARLAARGVLEPVGDPGGVRPPRYRMMRAVREFGSARLREAGEFPVAAERRLGHCRRVAAVAANLWSTGGQRQAVRLLQNERDDLTAMLRHARTQPDHAGTALETVVNLWFWWGVYDNAAEGRDHLTRLLPVCDAGSALNMRGLWLAAWLTAHSDPQAAEVLLGRAWPSAVLAGDDAVIGRLAHVEGLLALHRHDERAAAEHFRHAADIIPPYAPGGPSAAVSRAAQAVAQAGFAPHRAQRSARRALTVPGVRDDAWATAVARCAGAYADHRSGHSGRARQRARRTLAALDPELPAPHVCAALRQLIADIESGSPGRRRLPYVPPPRAGRVPDAAARLTGPSS
ncbi:hypothetical protein H0H10_24080 [Streptomyces sp. TRM S81-3]|uniref:Uncharacterized protein n=1 Tax=Streptomyces griseicoloratus TaxID=2752516 RepID=A0A926QTL9_9ACTN|nr:hypothetical protein [Streptomyces griseicoloratus]MBD0422197.1 hypothetical protein [Streptomyces griseicoloratus]